MPFIMYKFCVCFVPEIVAQLKSSGYNFDGDNDSSSLQEQYETNSEKRLAYLFGMIYCNTKR